MTGNSERRRAFDAAGAGDIEAVRRAFEAGFDPGATDDDGRTIHQIAKASRHEAIELLAREFQERDTRPGRRAAGGRRHPRCRRAWPRRRAHSPA